MVKKAPEKGRYESQEYWSGRFDLIYYQYVDYIIRTVARDAISMLDVGTGNCPYLEWFDWIDRRVSLDIANPYTSPTVEGVTGNVLDVEFERRFDICTCLQVLEHVKEPGRFSRRLLELARTVVISVPYQWPKGRVRGHIHDPVSLKKLTSWVGREPDYHIRVREPFRVDTGQRLIALYCEDGMDLEEVMNHSKRRQSRSSGPRAQ